MEIVSLTFILLVLPVFIGSMRFIKNNKMRNLIILLFSLCFYVLNAFEKSLIIVLIIIVSYGAGRLLEKKKSKVIYGLYLICVLSILCLFKYGSYFEASLSIFLNTFSIEHIVMPLGISFYTFTSISYVSDIYYEKISSDNILNVATYLSFFPTVTSGPILRYGPFKAYLEEKTINSDTISEGLREFILGLFKKVVIANGLAMITDVLFASDFVLSRPTAVLGAVCFTLQIYYDFSSYSNMAIGIAKMIGFDIDKNFDHPYWSRNIQEFWRRWHISLSSWFRDYVYIPLGGNRVSEVRWIFNTMVVWVLTGVWHGSTLNFMLWGIYNGVLLIGFHYVKDKIRLPAALSWLLTQMCVCLGFLIFKTGSLGQLFLFVKTILFGENWVNLIYLEKFNIIYKFYTIVLAVIGLIPVYDRIQKKFPVLMDIAYIILLIISIIMIMSGSYSSFIYSNF